MNARRITYAAICTMCAAVLTGCAVPFTVVTETITIELPVLSQFVTDYQEERVELPSEALRDGVSFTNVRFFYTITTDSPFRANVEIWVSDDQSVDGESDPDTDDKIVDVVIENQSTVSGSADSPALVRALNAKQEFIVVGGFAESLTGGGTVTITTYAEIEGSVQPASAF